MSPAASSIHADEELDCSQAEFIQETSSEKKTAAPQQQLVSLSKLFTFADATDKWLMFAGTLCAFGSGITQPLQIVVFGDVINAFNQDPASVDPSQALADINTVCLHFVWISIAALITGFGQVAFWSITASRQARALKYEYVKAILRQDIGWFDTMQSTELATQVADSTLSIQDGMGRKVGDGAQFFAMGVSGIAIGLLNGWKLSLALLGFTPLLAATAYLMMKVLADAVHGGSAAYAHAGGIAQETIGNIRTVQSFNGMEVAVDKYASALDTTEAAGVKKGLAVGVGTGVMFGTVFCAYSFGMYYGAVLVSDDLVDACVSDCYDGGRVLIVFFSTIMGAMALGQAGPSLEAVFKARAAAVSVFELIERTSAIDSSLETGLVLPTIKGHVSFQNITFRYPSRPEATVCNNFSLDILPGQTVALVGSSGCGKSTAVGLLERFYDPEMGVVQLDGHDIKTINVKHLRQSIGLVNQEPSLFQTSVAKNIGLGKEGASSEEIIQAAKMANAYDFIMEMPAGFDTEVGERGVQLSGGQKQRIAIARAILKDPSILLLDEATSALDTESEHVVQQSLNKLLAYKKRTTIIIAHRLSTIRDADKIAVIHDGHVAELGSHEELMNIPEGKYLALVNASASSAVPEKASTSSTDKIVYEQPKTVTSSVPDTIETETEEAILPDAVPMARLWKMSRPDLKFLFIGAVGAAVNGSTFPVWGVLLTKATVLFFNIELSRSAMLAEARWWAIAFALLGLVFAISMVLQNWGFSVANERLTKRLRILGFSAIIRQEIAYFDVESNSSGALTTRLATDVALIQSMTSEMLNRNLVTLFTLGVAFTIAFIYSWEMTLILLASFPFLAIGSYIQMQAFNGTVSTKVANSSDSQAGSLLTEAIGNVRTVASFTMEKHMQDTYLGFLCESKQTDRKTGIAGGLGFGFANMLILLVQAFLFWAGGLLVFEAERIDFQDMFMVLLAVMFSSFGLGMAAQNMVDAKKAKLAAIHLFSVIDRVPKIDATSTKGLQPTTVRGDVEFMNVDFFYPERKTIQVYKQYSLKIKPGMTVALVGASGSGKSTAINLLEKFYSPDSGSVRFDDYDIAALNTRWLRDHISLVSQEPVLFGGTIAENIKYGKLNATRAEIEEAARKSNAFDFINQFPDGFDTDVGSRGLKVSGGQKQRIALARAIIRDPEVLLLDEATSALDSENEKIVQESLEKLLQLKKRTTIVVAHRLSTVRESDAIAVVHEGRIVELGKHEELLEIKNGLYANLISRQVDSADRR